MNLAEQVVQSKDESIATSEKKEAERAWNLAMQASNVYPKVDYDNVCSICLAEIDDYSADIESCAH
jgi:hypothetical protein